MFSVIKNIFQLCYQVLLTIIKHRNSFLKLMDHRKFMKVTQLYRLLNIWSKFSLNNKE